MQPIAPSRIGLLKFSSEPKVQVQVQEAGHFEELVQTWFKLELNLILE